MQFFNKLSLFNHLIQIWNQSNTHSSKRAHLWYQRVRRKLGLSESACFQYIYILKKAMDKVSIINHNKVFP